MANSLLDQYFQLFGNPAPEPMLPQMDMSAIPQAPSVAPTPTTTPTPQTNNPLDIIKALGGLVRRDPLGDTARRNSQSNQIHTPDEWRAMFAPIHAQQAQPIPTIAPGGKPNLAPGQSNVIPNSPALDQWWQLLAQQGRA